jgi:hypothetical protein
MKAIERAARCQKPSSLESSRLAKPWERRPWERPPRGSRVTDIAVTQRVNGVQQRVRLPEPRRVPASARGMLADAACQSSRLGVLLLCFSSLSSQLASRTCARARDVGVLSSWLRTPGRVRGYAVPRSPSPWTEQWSPPSIRASHRVTVQFRPLRWLCRRRSLPS